MKATERYALPAADPLPGDANGRVTGNRSGIVLTVAVRAASPRASSHERGPPSHPASGSG